MNVGHIRFTEQNMPVTGSKIESGRSDQDINGNMGDVFIKSDESLPLMDLSNRTPVKTAVDNPRSLKNRIKSGLRTAVLITAMFTGIMGTGCTGINLNLPADSQNVRTEQVDTTAKTPESALVKKINAFESKKNELGKLIEDVQGIGNEAQQKASEFGQLVKDAENIGKDIKKQVNGAGEVINDVKDLGRSTGETGKDVLKDVKETAGKGEIGKLTEGIKDAGRELGNRAEQAGEVTETVKNIGSEVEKKVNDVEKLINGFRNLGKDVKSRAEEVGKQINDNR